MRAAWGLDQRVPRQAYPSIIPRDAAARGFIQVLNSGNVRGSGYMAGVPYPYFSGAFGSIN